MSNLKDIVVREIRSNSNSVSIEANFPVNGGLSRSSILEARNRIEEAIKERYGEVDYSLRPVVEFRECLERGTILGEVVFFNTKEPLLDRIKVKITGRENVEKIEFEVEQEFDGFPDTVSGLFNLEMRKIYGERVAGSRVRELKKSSEHGKKVVSFRYDLYLLPKKDYELSLCGEGCHRLGD